MSSSEAYVTPEGVDLRGLRKLCNHPDFCDYPVIIFDDSRSNQVVFKANTKFASHGDVLYLHYVAGHLNVITNVNAMMGKKGTFCRFCCKFLNGNYTHKCDFEICKQCKTYCDCSDNVAMSAESHVCDSCHRSFRSQQCFQNHLTVGMSPLYGKKFCVCESIRACSKCGRDLQVKNGILTGRNAYNKKDHVCFASKCGCCGKQVNLLNHRCYVHPVDLKNERANAKRAKMRGKFACFDVETKIIWDDVRNCEVFQPNLICYRIKDGRKGYFYGEDCCREFCDFLFVGEDSLAFDPQQTRYNWISHNGGRFDLMYILRYFIEGLGEMPNILWDGKRLLKAKFGNVVFFDSLNYLPMKLRDFSSAFRLETVKGDFPHKFNRQENEDYRGQIPDIDFYSPQFMTEKTYDEFLTWWMDVAQKQLDGELGEWVFKDELIKYCEADVDLLYEGWMKFVQVSFETTGIWPTVENCTLASFCNMVWRSSLDKNSPEIGLIPKGGYAKDNSHSKISLMWLKYLDAFYYGGQMHYAGKNAGEKLITVNKGQVAVDGYCEEGKVIFEFFGCFYHGCVRCYSPDSHSGVGGAKIRDLYTRTMNRVGNLRKQGYEVQYIWECEWRNEMETCAEVQQRLAEIEDQLLHVSDRLNPRDAFFGGRVEATRLYHCADLQEGEYIKFLDFTSLYPYVNKEGTYPVGHPEILRGHPSEFDYSDCAYYGLVKCSVLPPRGLFHPVLPARINEKLMFALCRTCAQELSREECSHSDEERTLHGTWATPELYRATYYGYVIKEITEVWHYKRKKKGMFADYVNKFLKIKQEASGFPKGVDTEEQKDTYVADYFKNEGVSLDKNNIAKNPCQRKFGKQCLNCLWGFWGRCLCKSETLITHNRDEFLKFIYSEKRSNVHMKFLNDFTVMLTGTPEEEFVAADTKGNLVIALFTTALARGVLYNTLLAELGHRILYMDTDSAAFIANVNQPELDPAEGNYLGDLTNVLENPSDNIIDVFMAGGPKNYGYTTMDRETLEEGSKSCLKIRCITLNRTSLKHVNLETLKKLLFNSQCSDLPKQQSGLVDTAIPVPRFTIARGDSADPFILKPVEDDKLYRLVFDKRRIDFDDYKCYPYGY